MILLWFTAGVVPAVLLGVYLPWSAWVLPVGLGSLAAGFLFKGLKKWPPLRRFLFEMRKSIKISWHREF